MQHNTQTTLTFYLPYPSLSLMSQLPDIFSSNKTQQVVLEPVVRAGMEALKAARRNGRLFVFHSSLPSQPTTGMLKNRLDTKLLGTDKEKVGTPGLREGPGIFPPTVGAEVWFGCGLGGKGHGKSNFFSLEAGRPQGFLEKDVHIRSMACHCINIFLPRFSCSPSPLPSSHPPSPLLLFPRIFSMQPALPTRS